MPSDEQSSTLPFPQQMLPGLQHWPLSPTYGAGTVGGAQSSVREEHPELASTLPPIVDNDFFAITPVGNLVPPHPGSFSHGTLPPFKSFDEYAPSSEPGMGDDCGGW
jgi:hypothetical protein